MAYLIFTANGYEIDRKELTGPAVIGRAPDADFHIRDILLSRNHCKIEPAGKRAADGWVVTDLGSKNGTYIGNTQITRHALRDGEELRLGRTRVTFRAGQLDPNHPGKRRTGAVVRPLDPAEALEGTVSGFILVEPDQVEHAPGAPIPRPRPPEPSAYDTEDVYGMLNEIMSSSWDSIQEQASKPIVKERPLPRPKAYAQGPARTPSRARVAFSLQAHPEAATREPASVETKPRSRRMPRIKRSAMLAGVAVLATTVLVSGWLAVVLGSAQFEARQLANSSLPRVTGEILVETQPPQQIDQAAPASESLPAEDEPAGSLETSIIADEQAASLELPPRPILIAGLRDAAVHTLIGH